MTEEANVIEITKKELFRYQDEVKNLKYAKEKIDTLKSRINRITPMLKDVCIQGGGGYDKGEQIAALADMQTDYEKQMYSAQITMNQIKRNIDQLDSGLQRRILENRYLYGHCFEKIAVKEELAYRTIRRQHMRSLQKYYDKFLKVSHDVL